MLAKLILIFFYLFIIIFFTTLGEKSYVIQMLESLIASFEQTDLTGPEKMEQVVAKAYKSTFPIFKAYFTKERLQRIAEKTYKQMKKFHENRSKK